MEISRRKFITGAMATSATAALFGLAGCAPQHSTDSSTETASSEEDFLAAPDPIDESEITATETADIIIVGAGTAGLTCAVSAAEEGKSVIVIAKDDAPSGQGGSHFAIGSKLTKELEIEFDAAEAVSHELQLYSYRVSGEQWSVYANQSGTAMDWYMDLMEEGGLQCTLEVPAYNCGGFTQEYYGSHIFYGGPNDAPFGDLPDELDILVKKLESFGQKIMFNITAQQLVRDNENTGRVSAVIAIDADGNYTKFIGETAVILATGDYGNNEELKKRFCPITAGMASMKAPANNTGDGHKMAYWIGAAFQKNENHSAMIFGAMDLYKNLMVNEKGIRFGNERVSNAFGGMEILMQPGKHIFSIWDADYAQVAPSYPARLTTQADTPEVIQATFDASVESGQAHKADTIEELAQLVGIDPAALSDTIEHYNKLCDAGYDQDYLKSSEFLFPIRKAPFYIQESTANLLVTLGGMDVNVDMQVLDTNGGVIEGLYALGAIAGNFYANVYTTYFAGTNLGRNICFGYLTGKALAAR